MKIIYLGYGLPALDTHTPFWELYFACRRFELAIPCALRIALLTSWKQFDRPRSWEAYKRVI